MAEEKDIDRIIETMFKKKPDTVNRKFAAENAGMNCVMRILDDAGGPMLAGDISRKACFSTARTAVLIKKMQEKGFVRREEDKKDRRKALITLTEKGSREVQQSTGEFREMVARLIDEIGMKELDEFCATAEKIRVIAEMMLDRHMENFNIRNGKD